MQTAIEKTRRLIVDLYVKCENDYVNGVKLYEAIVESKILETTQKQIETLKTQASNIIKETKKISNPVKEELVVKPPPPFVNEENIDNPIDTEIMSSSMPMDSSIKPIPVVQSTEPMQPMQ